MEINLRDKLKIFIGSGEASLLEKKVCIYSLKKNSNLKNFEIFCFNGTHDTLEDENGKVLNKIQMDLNIKYENNTEFTFYKFLVPDICSKQGKALFMDSDILCLGDLNELFEINLKENDIAAKKSAYSEDEWGTSVLLFDCRKFNLNLNKCFEFIKEGKYSKNDLLMFTKKFRSFHNIKIKSYDDKWNSFDYYDKDTRLLHYTNLHQQPWKYHNNKYGKIWFKYFFECVNKKIITDEDIQKSIDRSYVRQDIMDGNDLSIKKLLINNARYFKKRLINLF